MQEIFKKKFTLLVSLPQNNAEFAKAAEEGGADGVKIHLNVSHFASGTDFGPWKEEKKNVEKILQAIKIPVGLLPGAEIVATAEEIIEARDMGIDFLDAFAHHMPLYVSKIKGLGKMLAVNREYSEDHVKTLEYFGMDMMEATILPHIEYGKKLTYRDLALYAQLARWIKKPLVIPTQKKITPEETYLLKKAGASGIVIGAVVTGGSPKGVFEAARKFNEAIRNMPEENDD